VNKLLFCNISSLIYLEKKLVILIVVSKKLNGRNKKNLKFDNINIIIDI